MNVVTEAGVCVLEQGKGEYAIICQVHSTVHVQKVTLEMALEMGLDARLQVQIALSFLQS